MNGELTAITRSGWRAAPWQGFRLWLLAIPASLLCGATTTSLSMVSVGLGFLMLVPVITATRALTDVYRDLIGRWTGHRIERPYLPDPEGEPGSGFSGLLQRLGRMVSDPATWRDLGWLLADPVVAACTAALPAMLIIYGVWGWLLAAFAGRLIVHAGGQEWYTFIPVDDGYAGDPLRLAGTVAVGAALVTAGFLSGPRMLDIYGRWGRLLLGPTEKSRLALRVQRLTETRSAAMDASAAELRRIERDLHDGAQARLVAMGMSLGAIEHLLDRDPEKARLLLSQARESSAKALSELRDLVRGIHPPVLADRGLTDAVRALALDSPLRIEVEADLPGRPRPPVESAAYFAVAELLANAAKHSGATRVWIDLRHQGGMLRIDVTDDGAGGASLEGGTGLRGIERRIGTFDGVLALISPPGGPTTVTMELPCDLT